MNIQEITENFKSGVKGVLASDDLYTFLLVVLVGAAAFGLGRVSVEPSVMAEDGNQTATVGQVVPTTSKTIDDPEKPEILPEEGTESTPGQYVASKNGTKYHLPWCGGAKQIKEENKVWFETKEEAASAGYTPAANCKGI